MIGAIAGDIIGSVFEHRNIKTKNFALFNAFSRYTDDSVMTLAVAEALLRSYPLSDSEEAAFETAECMHRWGQMFPYAGYGGNFMKWLRSNEPKPYNSLGNGSAMRVSSVAWIYRDNFEKMRAVARATAMPTHNHPEGIKGADAVASAIGISLNGGSKKDIKNFIEKKFGYNLERSLDDIRPTYFMDATCPGSVPEAIIAFLEGNDFEDVVRGAVSIGGDSDTIAAIAGSIAEAFYGIPEDIVQEVRSRLTAEQNKVVDVFNLFREGDRFGAVNQIRMIADWNLLAMNQNIEAVIDTYNVSPGENTLHYVLEAIKQNIDWGKVYVPGQINDSDDGRWIIAVTGAKHMNREYELSGSFYILNELLCMIIDDGSYKGLLLNPWTQSFELTLQMMDHLK